MSSPANGNDNDRETAAKVLMQSGIFTERKAREIIFVAGDSKSTKTTTTKRSDEYFNNVSKYLDHSFGNATEYVRDIIIDAWMKQEDGLLEFIQRGKMFCHDASQLLESFAFSSAISVAILKWLTKNKPDIQPQYITIFNACNKSADPVTKTLPLFLLVSKCVPNVSLLNHLFQITDPARCDHIRIKLWSLLSETWRFSLKFDENNLIMAQQLIMALLHYANDDGTGIYVEEIQKNFRYQEDFQFLEGFCDSPKPSNIQNLLSCALYKPNEYKMNNKCYQIACQVQRRLQYYVVRRKEYASCAESNIASCLTRCSIPSVLIDIVIKYMPNKH